MKAEARDQTGGLLMADSGLARSANDWAQRRRTFFSHCERSGTHRTGSETLPQTAGNVPPSSGPIRSPDRGALRIPRVMSHNDLTLNGPPPCKILSGSTMYRAPI